MGKEGYVRYFLRYTEIIFPCCYKEAMFVSPPPLIPPLSWVDWLSMWFKITKKLNDHKCPSFTSTLSWTHKVKALSLKCCCENSIQKGSQTNLYTSINMNNFCIFPKQTTFSKESMWQHPSRGFFTKCRRMEMLCLKRKDSCQLPQINISQQWPWHTSMRFFSSAEHVLKITLPNDQVKMVQLSLAGIQSHWLSCGAVKRQV